jgi:hypothetical protein
MPRTLEARRMGDVTDWSGQCLRKRVLDYLGVGCIVRVIVDNVETGGCECLYFAITRVKDGTFWGTCQETYRMGSNSVGLASGEQFSFRKEHISEVPVSWQPKQFQRLLAPSDFLPLGYGITGYR